MKRYLLFFIMVAAILSLSPNQICNAQDIWVDHWSDENYEIYVMDDTIVKGPNEDYTSFQVVAKQVKDDTLVNVVLCKYVKWPDDAWRFRTSESEGTNYSAVAHSDPVFEFCMKKLGWSCTLDNGLYY